MGALVGDDACVLSLEEEDVALLDDGLLLAQTDERPIEMEDGVRVRALCLGVDRAVIRRRGEPRRTVRKARVLRRAPLHRRAAVVARACGEDGECLVLRFPLIKEDFVVVQALHVAVLCDVRVLRVRHAELLALIDVGRAAHEMDARGEHLRGCRMIALVVAETADDARLIVVAPEDGVPSSACRHALLPDAEKIFQRHDVGLLQCPLCAATIVNLQMVEAEHHREFLLGGVRVADAVLEGGGGHLTDGNHRVDPRVAREFLEKLVDVAAVRVEAAPVALIVVLEDGGLRDEVDDIEAESLDALFFPEADDVLQLLAHARVLPVEICLRHVEEVEVVFFECRDVLPRVPAELRDPVRGRCVGRAVFEDVVIDIVGIARKRAPEPRVLGRCMVEYHVEHDTDPARLCLADESIDILHCAEARVDGAVVGDIVAAIVLRRDEERREPEEVDAEFLQIVEFRGDARQIAESVAVRVIEGFGVDLVDDLVLYVHVVLLLYL